MLSWLRNFFGVSGAAPNAGERGEQIAAAWLVRERGFTVVARNWRSPLDRRDEIDLVCQDAGVLVFVEVKARAAGALVSGYHAIDARKKRVLRRAIKIYLSRLPAKPGTFRFDVVEVRLGAPRSAPIAESPAGSRPGAGGGPAVPAPDPEVLHFENVPLFSKHFHA